MLFYLEPIMPKKQKSVGDEESSSIVPTGTGVGVAVVVVVILLAFVIYRMKRYTLNKIGIEMAIFNLRYRFLVKSN